MFNRFRLEIENDVLKVKPLKWNYLPFTLLGESRSWIEFPNLADWILSCLGAESRTRYTDVGNTTDWRIFLSTDVWSQSTHDRFSDSLAIASEQTLTNFFQGSISAVEFPDDGSYLAAFEPFRKTVSLCVRHPQQHDFRSTDPLPHPANVEAITFSKKGLCRYVFISYRFPILDFIVQNIVQQRPTKLEWVGIYICLTKESSVWQKNPN